MNPPLFIEDDNTLAIEKYMPPELHILQGFVNHLFWNGFVPLLGREKALLWPKKLKLVSKNYQGDVFEGNACRKLIKSADYLNRPQNLGDKHLIQIIPFISTFKALDKVVNSSFSTKNLCRC